MILRITRQVLDKEEKCSTEDMFFDGFDQVSSREQEVGELEKPCSAFPSSHFTNPDAKRCHVLMLIKGDTIVRYVVVDMSYGIYLMSDTGKTIERLS